MSTIPCSPLARVALTTLVGLISNGASRAEESIVWSADGAVAEVAAIARPVGALVELPYEKIARDFAAGHGMEGVDPGSLTYEVALDKAFVRLSLGAFDLRFPCTSLDANADALRTAATAIVTAQEKYLDWISAGGADPKSLHEDAKVLANWIKGWRAPVLAKGKTQPGADLFQVMGASDAVVAASTHWHDALAKGAALGPAREKALVSRLVFAPTRKDFTEFVYFVGWVQPDQRSNFWLDGVPGWTQCFVNEDQVLALEYAGVGRQPNDYTTSMSMDEVLPQQVAQLAMNSLFSAYYGDRLPAAFISGLSMNLVIEAYGMVQTRVDGDTRSRVTGKREVFIAGGASEGGLLGKNSAETKWRETGGKDHFLGCLRTAQSEGGKLTKDAKNKLACFAVRSDKGGDKWAALGPFFGPTGISAQKEPPPEFQGDFAEFTRAYKSAFLYWLQSKAGGTEKVSREKFAVLLKKLADPNLTGDFDAVFAQVFDGAKLSAPGADKDTLEGKFLTWLSK